MNDTRTSKDVSLLPCPFCGGEAATGTIRYSDRMIREQNWGQDTFHKINCVMCGANNLGLVGFRTEALAIEAWNKRHSHEPGLEVPILRNCLGNLYAAIQRTERFVGDADIKFAMREAAIALGPPYSTVTKGANDA